MDEDTEATRAFFEDRLGDPTTTAVSAVDWSAEGQRRRFEVLCEVGDLHGASVLDVGCGLAGLGDYLREQGLGVRYVGVDIVPEFVSRARDKGHMVFAAEATELPFEERFDFVLASGLFYRRRHAPFRWMESVVRSMARYADRALAFNSLSGDWPDESDEWAVQPRALVEMLGRLGRRWVVRHDYAPHDVTAYVYTDELAGGTPWRTPAWTQANRESPLTERLRAAIEQIEVRTPAGRCGA